MSQYGNLCTGHYVTEVNSLIQHHELCLEGGEVEPDRAVVNLAKKCCFSVEGVKYWMDYILNTRENRKRLKKLNYNPTKIPGVLRNFPVLFCPLVVLRT